MTSPGWQEHADLMFHYGEWSVFSLYRFDSVSCPHLMLCVQAAHRVGGEGQRCFGFTLFGCTHTVQTGDDEETEVVYFLLHDCDLPFAYYQKDRHVLLRSAGR